MVEIVIVYDNSAKGDFIADWGFSCFIKTKGVKVLFDTGADADILAHNLILAGLDDFDYVFLSHEHYDHVGGLNAVLDKTSCVIALSSFSKKLKNTIKAKTELVEVDKALEFEKGLYSTGELGRFVKEQSLVVEVKGKYFVITGCSHPGLDVILAKAEEFGEVMGVMGGFHGFNRLEILKRYEIVIPCHCTVYKREILAMDNSRECFAGCRLKL